MSELAPLGLLGLTLPSPAYIVGLILFGIVGYVAFRRGRRASRSELTWGGVALMVFPYAVSETWLLWLIGALLCLWLYAKCDSA
jgi:hypothetical protein